MDSSQLLAHAGLALALTAALVPLAERLALRWGFVDRPAGHKYHRRPTPLLGGPAIFLGVWLTLLALGGLPAGPGLRGVAGAAAWITLWGLWDDRRGLPVGAKLAVQAVAAGIAIASGMVADLPLAPWAAVAVTFLWIVGATNAVNLLDNMDGVAAGVAAVAAAFLALATAGPAAALAAATAGAAAGFLVFNFPPARLFMGDAGSHFLGLTVAVLGVEVQRRAAVPAGWTVPVLILGVPIFDTALVTVSRLRRGRNPLTTPGKDHLPHRLVRLGLSERTAAAGLWGLGAALGGLALWVGAAGSAAAWVVFGALFAAGAAALVWLERKSP